MSLQKHWGNFHLNALGAMMLSVCSSDAITASRKTPRHRRPPSAPLTWW
jgi:hypothetical protein